MTASLEGQINSISQGEDSLYAEEPLVCWGWGRARATNAAKHIKRKHAAIAFILQKCSAVNTTAAGRSCRVPVELAGALGGSLADTQLIA